MILLVILVVIGLVYVGLPALLAALLFRGGLLLRVLGLALVRPDGTDASRLRIFCRGLISWSPAVLALLIPAFLTPFLGESAGAVVGLVVLVFLMTWSALLPDRSLPDRLAGTWLVRR
jgi:hypothetical protein